MRGVFLLLLILVAVIPGSAESAAPSLSFPEEVDRVRALLADGSAAAIEAERARIAAWLADKHLVFISGIMDDVIPGVFHDNIRAIEEDFGHRELTVIKPLSTHSVADNAIALARAIDALGARVPGRRLVLLSASKGGAETLLMLVEHPDWLASGKVHLAVGIQAAVKGSPLADLATPDCTADAQSWLCRAFDDLPYTREGLASLTHAKIQEALGTRIAALTPKERAQFIDRFFFVRASRKLFFDVSNAFKLTWLINLTQGGENDGMLLTAEQRIEGLGTDLGVLDSDHGSLFGSPEFSKEDYAFRRGFMWALMERLALTAPLGGAI